MRQSVEIELDQESIDAAQRAGLDLSQVLIEALRRRLPDLHAAERAEAARRWQEENRVAIDSYNRMIERDGFVFSDGVRNY